MSPAANDNRKEGESKLATPPDRDGVAADSQGLLVCTLGVSWPVIPEVLALLARDVVDLYRHHPQAAEIFAEVARRNLPRPAEVWVATTTGTRIEELKRYWHLLAHPPRLRIWRSAAQDLGSAAECEAMRELIFRLVAHACARVGSERVVLSLAGGRKTMSADLQWAGTWFGCAACLHVLTRAETLPQLLRTPSLETLAQPLPADIAQELFPVFLGPFSPSELLVADTDRYPRVRFEDYPLGTDALDPAASVAVVDWVPDERRLVDDLLERQRHQAEVYAGHLERLLTAEKRPNWYGLYRLPLGDIDFLRRTPLGEEHENWLRALPKAELHCHLGGVLEVRRQQEVGKALWDQLTRAERERAREAVAWAFEGEWPPDWSERLRKLDNRSEAVAAILTRFQTDELEERLFAPTEPRVALRAKAEIGGFRAYERPGELSGSALLQREAAIEEYAHQIVDRLVADGVRYCELRGSPQKYLRGQGERFLQLLKEALGKACRARSDAPVVKFLISLDRRQLRADQPRDFRTIERVVRFACQLSGFVVGFDVAGEEPAGELPEIAKALEPAFAACLPITIHAGEGEDAANVWEAVYRLHAERVGHGLTLYQAPELAKRMRDRGIAIELCPTSNVEVVGYYDPGDPRTFASGLPPLPEYPLRQYLDSLELEVVLCTDNPGISRTSLASEYLRAARMAGGLSLWRVLALVRAGFEHSFASAQERGEMLRRADAEIVASISGLRNRG